jgi:hypothetical protein
MRQNKDREVGCETYHRQEFEGRWTKVRSLIGISGLSHCDTFYVDLLDLVVFGVQFIEFFKRILRNHSFIHVDCSECLFFSEPLSLLLGTVGTLCLLIISTNINIYIMD